MADNRVTATSTLDRLLTFEEYRFYNDGTDIRYELDRGKLIPMPTPSALHVQICKFLAYWLDRYIIDGDLDLIATSDLGVRTGDDRSRIPDVVVCSRSVWKNIRDRSGAAVLNLGETPVLVIEVTSGNWRDDYILKRAEYAIAGIPEYWIVDANQKRVRILTHPEREDGYEHRDFVPGQMLRSPLFPDLELAVNQILSPPLVEELMKDDREAFQQLERDAIEQQKRLEIERERANSEQERADRLAELLRKRGIDPEAIEP